MSKERVHILGICGTFMGGLAILGKENGIDISGCDENIYPPMSDHLEEMGIQIMQGYDASLIPDADRYVIGNSISRGNPALEYLLSTKADLISGPDWLYKTILKDKKVIAVSGTHGKTTTTAMIAWIFEDQGIDVGYLIAGRPKDFHKSARRGKDDIFVLEADEYDTAFFDKRSKFIHYKPDTLIINNLEFDHADIFPDISYIYREFHHLIRTLKEEARIIFPTDDLNISKVLNMGCWSKLISYGINGQHENSISFSEDNTPTLFRIAGDEGELDWTMLGEHNARNAITAVLAAKQYGIEMKDALNSLKKFKGVAKRQDLLFEDHRLVLIEDFAHHPTAIKSTLEGIKKKFPNKRLIAAIELRSNTMKSGFHDNNLVEAVAVADKVFWKSEDFTQTEKLVGAEPSKSSQIVNISEFVKEFKMLNQTDDLLVVMSNGNFDNLTKLLLKEYKND
ncbi:MAG: UDP-N-acetylmuramate:L-alanyl-gamma-D-glutamyl-meso-diaminopimelate ligase [Gammaproteobacteria bacterium]